MFGNLRDLNKKKAKIKLVNHSKESYLVEFSYEEKINLVDYLKAYSNHLQQCIHVAEIRAINDRVEALMDRIQMASATE